MATVSSFITPSEHQTENVKFDGIRTIRMRSRSRELLVTSSIRRVDERTLVMTDKADGKVIETDQIVASQPIGRPDDHEAHPRPRQANCDGVRTEIGKRP